MTHAIQATEQICALPAVPTHDWAAQAANAIALISPTAIVGVLVARLDQSTGALQPISTGVSGIRHSASSSSQDSTQQSYYIQDKLERLTSIGFQTPDQTCTRGLVAPISLLHSHWKTTSLGQIFAAHCDQSPVVAIIPITPDHLGFTLIVTLAMDPERAPNGRSLSADHITQIMGQLVPILSRKAKAALEHVTNPKAWLTDREHEILDQLIQGHSVRVIAENLDRSSHTVHDHVKNLHKKLNASSRGELIAKALGYASASLQIQTPAPNPIVLTGTSTLAELKPGQAQIIQAKPLVQTTKAATPQAPITKAL